MNYDQTCRNWLRGTCNFKECKFQHFKTEVCQGWLKGTCTRSRNNSESACRYIHSRGKVFYLPGSKCVEVDAPQGEEDDAVVLINEYIARFNTAGPCSETLDNDGVKRIVESILWISQHVNRDSLANAIDVVQQKMGLTIDLEQKRWLTAAGVYGCTEPFVVDHWPKLSETSLEQSEDGHAASSSIAHDKRGGGDGKGRGRGGAGGRGGRGGRGQASRSSMVVVEGDKALANFKAPENDDKLCVICFSNHCDASFMHGNTAHIVCCYICATTNDFGNACPFCREPIERILKNYYTS